MIHEPQPFHDSRPHLVRPVRRDDTGRLGPTRAQLRRGEFRSTGRGWWVPAEVARTTDQRIVEASVHLPAHSAVTGWAALHWRGASWFDGTTPSGALRPVDLATGGSDVRLPPGVAKSLEHLPLASITAVDGLTVTTVDRSVGFEMRRAGSTRAAAVVAGMAAYDDLVDRAELALHLATQRSRTGIPQARDALALMEENWWSPNEAWTGLVWRLDADLPRLRCNVPVFDRTGRFVATPDLLDEEAGLAIEYDGQVHLQVQQRRKDVRRLEALRAVGLDVLVVMTGDLADRACLVDRMLTARRESRFAAESRRAWTTSPPEWWRPTLTVAQRRALDPEERRRWLPHRSGPLPR